MEGEQAHREGSVEAVVLAEGVGYDAICESYCAMRRKLTFVQARDLSDAALGAMMGALLGDAIGSHLDVCSSPMGEHDQRQQQRTTMNSNKQPTNNQTTNSQTNKYIKSSGSQQQAADRSNAQYRSQRESRRKRTFEVHLI